MPCLILTEKSKVKTELWFSRLLRYLTRKRSRSILGHINVQVRYCSITESAPVLDEAYLVPYLPRAHTEHVLQSFSI